MAVTRRRRTPQEAEAEIVAAVEGLLRHKPLAAISVDDVMAATSLSRPSFYQYFRDINQAALRVLADVGNRLFEVSERWLDGDGDPAADIDAAMLGLADIFATEGELVAALVPAAAVDAEINAAYEALLDRFIDATARRIRADQASGLVPPMDPRETATALVYMNERYLTQKLGGARRTDRRRVARTLAAIWTRTLYGSGQGGSA